MPVGKDIALQTIMMPILAVAAATAFFYYASPILIPIVMATALTYLLLPVVDVLKRFKIPHTGAVAIVMVVVLGIFVLLVILLIGQLGDLASSIPQYKTKIEAALNTFQEYVGEYLVYLPGDLGKTEDLNVDMSQVQQAGRYIFKGLGSITGFALSSLLIFFLTLFMLMDSELFQKKLRMIFGEKQSAATEGILTEINRQLKGFIVVKFSVAVGLAIVVTIGLLFFQVKYAYIWGPLVGFMNLIPYIGSIVSAIPPIIVAGIQHNSIMYMVYVAIFFLAIQFVEGNIVTPRLTSGSVDMNTLAVLLSAMYWGWLWGFIGIILAVPITAAIKVVCDHVEPLKPIGTMLGTGRSG